jgi:hypothetical protein
LFISTFEPENHGKAKCVSPFEFEIIEKRCVVQPSNNHKQHVKQMLSVKITIMPKSYISNIVQVRYLENV